MRAKNRIRTERKMKTPILVLCEGDTEKCYIDFLRSKYRLPIKIVSKTVGQQINKSIIKSIIKSKKNELKIIKTDKVECFLMYDADVSSVVEKVLDCKDVAVPLLSRPCLEIWFLAHIKKLQRSDISTAECIKHLKSFEDWKNYQKGSLSDKQQKILWDNKLTAVANISHKIVDCSVFSTVKDLIERLENIKSAN